MRVSLDRRRPLVRRPYRSRSRRPDARPALAARARRPERRGQVDAAPPRRRARRAGRGHGRADARVADRRLPAAGARPPAPARRCWATSPGAPASRRRRRRSKRHTADWSPDAYAAALERFLALGGGDLEVRARTVCAELGLPVSLDQETATLSGGEAARAALAAILLSRFDLLLLDEPTNDLDFDGLDRLERFVDGFAGGLAVVSHDRAFLDRTVDRIAEIDPGPAACASTRAAGATSPRRASEPRRSSTPPSSTRRSGRREVEALLHARRNQARAGGGFLAHATGGSDRRGTKALSGQGAPGGAGARADRAGREAVRAVAAAPLARGGAAARRPCRVARGRRRRPRRPSGSARSTSTSLRASASRSRAGTAAASRRSSRCCSASCRSRPGAARSAARP